MALIESFIRTWEYEFQNTMKVLKAIPEDQIDYKAHEKFFSVGKLVWHIVKIEAVFGRGVLNDQLRLSRSYFNEMPDTIAEMIKISEDDHPKIVAGWRTLGDAAFKTKIPMIYPDGKVAVEAPRIGYLQTGMMGHTIHHRGQLMLILRMLGVKVPSVYGRSGDAV